VATSCPLRNYSYGGLPTGGGYGSDKEYEIGAQSIAEAVHCILGSLGRHVGDNDWAKMLDIEQGHIHEELGIVKKTLGEYSKSLYIEQLNKTQGDAYTEKCIAGIRDVSPKLAARAKGFQKNLEAQTDVPEEIKAVGILCYEVVQKLADALVYSVRDWPKPIEYWKSAFSSRQLERSVDQLESAIKKMYQNPVVKSAFAAMTTASEQWVKPKINITKGCQQYLEDVPMIEGGGYSPSFTLDPGQTSRYIPELFHQYGETIASASVKFSAVRRKTPVSGQGSSQFWIVDPKSVMIIQRWRNGDAGTIKNVIRDFFYEPWSWDDNPYNGWDLLYDKWIDLLKHWNIRPVPFTKGNNRTKQPFGPIGYIVIEQKEAHYEDRDNRSQFRVIYYFTPGSQE